ncbi:hypothetical protein COCSUDRAFT_64414 [Coccomyxa subellipsoidea C-169]|uniref:Uncharacterized protein n=1 Tax=Coccomyxa subellipsoidea (strain C-169) TaxID=574566 RepID=I0Z6J6_COCSC|nr:hypothetical protein COCSUDRAFT_64414 [Coccomyxa subellipsoidea C-169]EIE26265.1 hypothetical protein COCSUDRAFT_64414 [Coccomyxa subellipsoidea C-169]|eukprot:XP_005650809.1 hypothetical protein COCSUDRAFT_64414 [Coccomyxa subellipsoidea C-169]
MPTGGGVTAQDLQRPPASDHAAHDQVNSVTVQQSGEATERAVPAATSAPPAAVSAVRASQDGALAQLQLTRPVCRTPEEKHLWNIKFRSIVGPKLLSQFQQTCQQAQRPEPLAAPQHFNLNSNSSARHPQPAGQLLPAAAAALQSGPSMQQVAPVDLLEFARPSSLVFSPPGQGAEAARGVIGSSALGCPPPGQGAEAAQGYPSPRSLVFRTPGHRAETAQAAEDTAQRAPAAGKRPADTAAAEPAAKIARMDGTAGDGVAMVSKGQVISLGRSNVKTSSGPAQAESVRLIPGRTVSSFGGSGTGAARAASHQRPLIPYPAAISQPQTPHPTPAPGQSQKAPTSFTAEPQPIPGQRTYSPGRDASGSAGAASLPAPLIPQPAAFAQWQATPAQPQLAATASDAALEVLVQAQTWLTVMLQDSEKRRTAAEAKVSQLEVQLAAVTGDLKHSLHARDKLQLHAIAYITDLEGRLHALSRADSAAQAGPGSLQPAEAAERGRSSFPSADPGARLQPAPAASSAPDGGQPAGFSEADVEAAIAAALGQSRPRLTSEPEEHFAPAPGAGLPADQQPADTLGEPERQRRISGGNGGASRDQQRAAGDGGSAGEAQREEGASRGYVPGGLVSGRNMGDVIDLSDSD